MYNKFTTLHDLLIFIECLKDSEINEIHFIQSKYLKYATDFDGLLLFLLDLSIVSRVEERLYYSDSLLKVFEDSNLQEAFKNLVINNLLVKNNVYYPILHKFFVNFVMQNNKFEFMPNNLQMIEFSSLRDLLNDIGIITINDDGKLTVQPDNMRYVSKFIITNANTIEELNEIQKVRSELGVSAEKIIIEYEANLLSSVFSDFPEIMHVGQRDCKMGFDIISYELYLDKDGHFIPKYIEVKAVSIKDYKFFWTRNEMMVAKKLCSSYFLYLLPFTSLTDYDLKKLKKISDPYNIVYKTKDKWDSEVELTSFSLK